jgi:hypothetical protein
MCFMFNIVVQTQYQKYVLYSALQVPNTLGGQMFLICDLKVLYICIFKRALQSIPCSW